MSTNKRPVAKVELSDRISRLPDSVLLHILSFLQTKDVVATSLLSKRWRTLWRSLPKLDFDDRSFCSVELFLQFVDAALQLVHLNSVQMFVLKSRCFTVPPVKVNIWVNAVVSYKLTHLELHFPRQSLSLPSSIFICSTLNVLKLTGLHVTNLSMVDLPSLKVLHLKEVRFPNSKCAARLLSNCVHLEELVLNLMVIPFELKDSMRSIATFEHLLFADLPTFVFPMKVLSNVQFLHLHGDIIGFRRHNTPRFHNLIQLQIEKFTSINWNIVSLLGGSPKLKSLTIRKHGDYGWEDEGSKDFSTPDVPPCVSSHLMKFAVFGFKGSDLEFEIVKFIMKYATVLRTVIVGSTGTCERKDLEMLKKLSSYPRCSATCRLIFDNFGKSTEEAMRKYLTIRK